MTSPSATELQRWSHEVARDPGAPSFVQLAEAYRRQGHREAALRVCLRGLSRHPAHVDAHALLGRLYLERGERDRAADEWSVVLRLDPDNFEAHRGLGFFSLERGDLGSAERHLARGRALRPEDRTVAAAVELLRERQARSASAGPFAASAAPVAGADRLSPPATPGLDRPAPAAAASTPSSRGTRTRAEMAAAPLGRMPSDPASLFDELRTEASFRGAFVLDAQGLVLGGTVEPMGQATVDSATPDRTASVGEVLGARMGPVIEEASRTAHHVGLGRWTGLMIETSDSLLNVSPLEEAYAIVVIAARGTPPAWVVRMSERAREIARPFVEA